MKFIVDIKGIAMHLNVLMHIKHFMRMFSTSRSSLVRSGLIDTVQI